MLGECYQRQATEPILLHHKFPCQAFMIVHVFKLVVCKCKSIAAHECIFCLLLKCYVYTLGCHNFFAFLKCIFLGSRLRCQLQ